MVEQSKKITNYLRKTILAQVDKGIDFKSEEFYKISKQSFLSGEIDTDITDKLFEKNKKETKKYSEKEEKEKNIDESICVILAAKVIRTEVEGSQKKEEREDLTGIFFIPAILNKKTSSLLPAMEYNKLPWFPREFLKPMIEPELAIGDGESYDKIVSDEIYNIYKIVSWQEYMGYCKNIYETTTKCSFEKDEICNMNGKKEKILLENNVYLFLDKTIHPSHHIKKLYNNIIKQDIELPLYENFINLEQQKDKPLIENTIENQKKHCGQMGGQYPLSPSQREVLNHFNNMEESDILAVKGPPGTGKTTLLQSVVANEYVKSALAKEVPKLIVASSTNNQAVTNIIESFGKIEPKFNNNLETRWIEKVNSFAMYFPSKQKVKSAKKDGFQYTNSKGEYSVAEIDNEENIKKSREKFLTEVEKIFPKANPAKRNISYYKESIHKTICYINSAQTNLIDIVQELEEIIGKEDAKQYIKQKKEYVEKIRNENEQIRERTQLWKNQYKQIPKLWKMLAWIKKYQIKISNKLKIYVKENENFEKENINMDIIEDYYAKKIEQNNEEIRKENKILEKIEQTIQNYNVELKKLKKCFIQINDIQENLITNKEKLEEWLDTNTRYISFWLAVHYYEARWLEEEFALTKNQKGTTYSNVLRNFYKRLSMITPCMVMTFYMLPKQFEVYNDEENKEFLYKIIDTLIVDEAGQVSTEIAACSFALAKKAFVVGDDKQLQPVWGVEKPLDKSLAIQEKVIENPKEFKLLQQYGITASSSSVMEVACKSCKYSKYGEKGLFLSEHRRCFDDIIKYCNKLVYKNKLQHLRGNGKSIEILPKMGYHLIETKKSKRVGTSRINTTEAIGIAKWILKNEKDIFNYYAKISQDKILGIITPFKEQAREIRRVLKQMLPPHIINKITVGTIHVFQGGERKIIIMSTTYGSEDGCFFIDYNKNMMNVAVSRAEDSFLVFGDINCLKEEEQSPSGLLKKYIIKNRI